MKLSYKDIKFIIEAIDNLESTYASKLDSENIDEDEAADLGNDCMFLNSLRHTLESGLESNPGEDRSKTSSLLQQLSSKELMEIVLELPIDRRLALTDAITQSIRQELLIQAA